MKLEYRLRERDRKIKVRIQTGIIVCVDGLIKFLFLLGSAFRLSPLHSAPSSAPSIMKLFSIMFVDIDVKPLLGPAAGSDVAAHVPQIKFIKRNSKRFNYHQN